MNSNNPAGLDGFEFVEFASPNHNDLERVFHVLGFMHIASHRSKNVQLWRQGDINFIINREPGSLADYFAEEHGPSACGMAFRVKDAHHAYKTVIRQGAQPISIPTGPMELNLPAIKGIGGAPLYLVDRYRPDATIYDIDFEYRPGVDREPVGVGLQRIDHLTHNVYRGRLGYWAEYYEHLFNFHEIRRFDIKGQSTGLVSRAMTAPDGKIRIPLNEEARSDRPGQIEDYLMAYNGEGIQHIAFSCNDLPTVIDRLADRGLSFLTPPPDAYYEMLSERLPGHGEPVERLRPRGILLDGDTSGKPHRLLLQIFSENMIGPIFFEFIERKADEGFGEGNFQALFESMEREQNRKESA